MNQTIQLAILILLGFICFGQFCFIIYQDYRHEQERKDLYSRWMARDLPEFESSKRNYVPRSRNTVKRGIKNSIEQLSYNRGD